MNKIFLDRAPEFHLLILQVLKKSTQIRILQIAYYIKYAKSELYLGWEGPVSDLTSYRMKGKSKQGDVIN